MNFLNTSTHKYKLIIFQTKYLRQDFKQTSCLMRHLIKSDGELCNSIDLRFYIASLLYRAIIHKPIALHEKGPHTVYFLVRIFLCSD